MELKETSKKRFYLKWPWNVIVYVLLVVVLRIFAIPLILLIMWWNRRQQPDGPEEGYCLQRTRGRLTGLIPAALLAVGGGLAIWFFAVAETMPYEAERLKEEISFGYYLIPVAGAGAILVGLFLAYRSLRDALHPEKSALAQSIRDQLPYPEEAPKVKELFAMVDQDLKQNGQWCGKLGVGREWVLGDEVSSIPRIRGVFSRVERHTRHAGKRTQVTYLYEIRIVDDRQQQVTSLKSKREVEEAMDCLRQRAPAAVFGEYNSREYNDLIYAKEEEQRYAQERAYRNRAAQFEEQNRREQEQRAQNQVLTLPDGSVTSRITWDTIHQLLRQPDQTGETAPFQLVPGVPFQGQGRTFSRLVCLAGGTAQPTRILMEEYSGTPNVSGQYAWARDLSAGEAETVLRGWLRGEIPALDGWTYMERSGRTWQPVMERQGRTTSPTPPQPHPDWPWTLTVGGYAGSTADPSWQDIEEELRELVPDPDSFLILEQKDPQNLENYWFIQCAVAIQGPDAGKYAVEIGCSTPGGPCLWERMVPDVQEAAKYFSDAYDHRPVNVSDFQEVQNGAYGEIRS